VLYEKPYFAPVYRARARADPALSLAPRVVSRNLLDNELDDHVGVGDRHYVALSFLRAERCARCIRDTYSRNCEIGDFFESVNDTWLLGVDLHDER